MLMEIKYYKEGEEGEEGEVKCGNILRAPSKAAVLNNGELCALLIINYK